MAERTERIAFAVTPEEKEMVRAESNELNTSMSELIRRRTIYDEPLPEESGLDDFFDQFANSITEQLDVIENCACWIDTSTAGNDIPMRYEPPSPPENLMSHPSPSDLPPMALDPDNEPRIVCRNVESRGSHGDYSGVVCELRGVLQGVNLEEGLVKPSDILESQNRRRLSEDRE